MPGATSAEQVRANVAAAGWRLAPDEAREVDRAARRELSPARSLPARP